MSCLYTRRHRSFPNKAECRGMRQKLMEPGRVYMGEAMRTVQNVQEGEQRKGERI
jgi:hypothetical protein